MPYIPEESRPLWDGKLARLLETPDNPCGIDISMATPGELNYIITSIVHAYAQDRVRYSSLNEIIGVLECVKAELYRQVIAPYENKKRAANGPVGCLDTREVE